MMILFDQEFAVEQYGRSLRRQGMAEGRAEGRVEGKIEEAISIYREELSLDNETIICKLMQKFHLSRNEAEGFVLSATA